MPRQKYAVGAITTFYSGGAYSWHRKLLVISNCRSRPQRRPLRPRSARLWASTALISPQFIKEFNDRTKDQAGFKIPVVITVYADRSFTFITKTPPTPTAHPEGHRSWRRAPAFPTRTKVGTITKAQVARDRRDAKCPT